MKKLIFACLVLAGCASESDKTLEKIETLYKQDLKDPSSYERIEAKIYDTVYQRTALRMQLVEDSANYRSAIRDYEADSLLSLQEGFKPDEMQTVLAPNRTRVGFALDYIRITENKLKEINGDGEVAYLSVKLKYRAKNGFGALDVFEKTLRYSPNDNTLLKDKN